MIKNLSILLLCVLAFSGCNRVEFTGTEEEQIQQYIEQKGLNVTETTESGLRYIRTKESNGVALQPGRLVTVKYRGELLSGKKFDNGAFDFYLLTGQVVRGFDEGIAKMKVGEEATLIFPSSLGYGSNGSGSIPANSPLVFEITVIETR